MVTYAIQEVRQVKWYMAVDRTLHIYSSSCTVPTKVRLAMDTSWGKECMTADYP
jgi:hypothetical protein